MSRGLKFAGQLDGKGCSFLTPLCPPMPMFGYRNLINLGILFSTPTSFMTHVCSREKRGWFRFSSVTFGMLLALARLNFFLIYPLYIIMPCTRLARTKLHRVFGHAHGYFSLTCDGRGLWEQSSAETFLSTRVVFSDGSEVWRVNLGKWFR